MSTCDTLALTLSDGQTVAVEVRRRKGARNLRLSLGHRNQVVASIPARCGRRELSSFIEKHKVWIEAQLMSAPPVRRLMDWLKTSPLLSGSGDRFTVRVEWTDRVRSDYIFDHGGSEICLRLPKLVDDREAALVQLVRRFAQDAMHCRTAYHAKRLGLDFGKLTVRDQSSRWGSCSSNRDISLNWRLVLLEPELQDYVILHELAHLTELNHSKRFWSLLETYDPHRKAHEARLDAYTAEIMRVGRQAE